jgi:hypothetical protein
MAVASGKGMSKGMASTKSKQKKSSGPSFDVSKSLLKSEKLYETLCNDSAKSSENDDDDYDTMTTEYVITARYTPSSSVKSNMNTQSNNSFAAVSDWVPVAQLCLLRPVNDPTYLPENGSSPCGDERVRMSISVWCREIFFAASLGAPIFNSVPRNQIQYSVEPIDSFYKFVYEDVIEGRNANTENGSSMTKSEARTILNLEEGCNDPSLIKKAYRSLSFQLHPDRFIGVERSEEERKSASVEYSKVQMAYESLSSGLRSNGEDKQKVQSWYESLGGRSRTDFSGAIELMSVEKAKEMLTSEYKCAVAGLNSETVMAFVTRNQAASRQ